MLERSEFKRRREEPLKLTLEDKIGLHGFDTKAMDKTIPVLRNKSWGRHNLYSGIYQLDASTS
jgi:hypothetical protein